MNILVVEDDENKRARLLDFFRERMGESNIKWAQSYHSASDVIDNAPLDLVILDMTIPTFDISVEEPGGRPQPYGGRDLLEAMDVADVAARAIVVTQFDHFGDQEDAMTLEELDRQLRTDYPNRYLGSVFYDSAREGWKESLAVLIAQATAPRSLV
jgi:DNA-binding NtrC family response regulator